MGGGGTGTGRWREVPCHCLLGWPISLMVSAVCACERWSQPQQCLVTNCLLAVWGLCGTKQNCLGGLRTHRTTQSTHHPSNCGEPFPELEDLLSAPGLAQSSSWPGDHILTRGHHQKILFGSRGELDSSGMRPDSWR